MTNQPGPSTDSNVMAGPIVMFLSAAIFAYFGFFVGLSTTTAAGDTVLMWVILLWTLRVGAIMFALAGVLAFASPMSGNVVYAAGSALSAIGLLAVGVMDLMDDQHAAAISPVLAFIFAAWNGYGAWASIREIMASRRAPA